MSVATEEYVFDELDRDAGSGSIKEGIANGDKGHYDTEWLDNRRTTFNPDDVESENNQSVERFGESQRKWDWYRKFDQGVQGRGRSKEVSEHDIVLDIETFGNQLNLTEYQIDRVKHLYDQVDMKRWRGDYTTDDVLFSLISLAQNEDVTPNGKDVRQTEMWTRLMIELNIDEKDIRKLRGEFHSLL